MFKILITDTDNHKVIVDAESNSVLLSFNRPDEQGVQACSLNHANPQVVSAVCIGALQTVDTLEKDEPILAVFNAVQKNEIQTKEVVKNNGRD